MSKPKRKIRDTVRVGVDTGGTFTDFVYESGRELRIFKVASTPDDPSRAIREGLERILSDSGISAAALEVVHGTTVGTNALLQRRGARTALVTTAGFEDVIEIGRQARPELYNLNAVKPPALIPRELRFGVHERVAASGEVLAPLNQDEVNQLLKSLQRANCDSVAVSLIFSFMEPRHEAMIEKALAKLGVPLSVSHHVLPEYREYERTATVVVNAYLQPLMGRYLSQLSGYAGLWPAEFVKNQPEAGAPNLRVMQSSGGSISAAAAAQEPVRTILSGPAGGVIGSLRAAGVANIITFDMGGTSTDVALCDRDGMRLTNESIVAGVPVAVPMMDIHTVGAGGGSIARIDEGGSLRVGPESAGADPGPACYGRSLLPTVTDAHAVLGHFPGGALLGGEFKLDIARARQALETLAAEMTRAARRKIGMVEAARGVLDVVTTNMERALRHISVERGYDPREFTLIPFGGAGGLHAVTLAGALRIPRVLVPASPGALSALGVLAADVVKEHSRTVMLPATPNLRQELETVFHAIERQATEDLRREGFPESRQRHERSVAARYTGKSFELQIKQTAGDIAGAFHRAHRARYGYAQEHNPVEFVSARVRSIGVVEKLRSRTTLPRGRRIMKPQEFTETYFARKRVTAAVYIRNEVPAGARLKTPCIVTEYSGTTLIPEGARAVVDKHGSLLIDVG